MKIPFKKSLEDYVYPKCDKIKGEIQQLELSFVTKIDALTAAIQSNEAARGKTDERIKDFLDKVENTVYGNGGMGMKTEMELMKQSGDSLKNDINNVGRKTSRVSDKVIEVEKQVAINTTKLVCYCGVTAIVVSLLSIFVPILIK